MEQQIKNFSGLISSYCDDTDAFGMPQLRKCDILECKIFASLNKLDLYDYLENKKLDGIRLCSQTLNIIDMTKDIFSQTLKHLEKSQEMSSRCVDEFNQCLKTYQHELIVREKKYSECLGSDLTELQALLVEVLKEVPYVNIMKLQRSFIDKSITIISRHDTEQCEKLLLPLMECPSIIQALQNEKLYCKNNLNTCIGVFNEILKSISLLDNTIN